MIDERRSVGFTFEVGDTISQSILGLGLATVCFEFDFPSSKALASPNSHPILANGRHIASLEAIDLLSDFCGSRESVPWINRRSLIFIPELAPRDCSVLAQFQSRQVRHSGFVTALHLHTYGVGFDFVFAF